VPEYCSLSVNKPATSASKKQVAEQEARLPFDPYQVLTNATRIDLPDVRSRQDLLGEAPPEDATVLDLRSPPARRDREIPGARTIDPLEVIERPETLDASLPYVVVCDEGSRSAWFASRLREMGFRAWERSVEQVALPTSNT
jgi:rhodanese-related sulfurtransferase